MRFRLMCLGEAGLVEDGGVPVGFPMGKPFGILAYLSLSTEAVPRDELAAVFWSDADPSRARHSLRQALSSLRGALGDDLFATDDPVAIEPAVLETDVDLLRQALRDGDADRILALYNGPFLETFQLASSPEWDHWVETQRRILEEQVAAALAEEAERVESPDRAVELLRRVVEIEPHRFRYRRALVEALLGQGDLSGATAALAETRQADINANGELDALEARLVAAREERRAVVEDGAEIRPEFVGRTAELAALAASWREATRGHRRIAILNGPTGIGKTRLAEELAGVASATGQVVHVKASSMERRLDWSMTAELARALYRLPGAAGIGAGAMNVLRSLVPSLGGIETPSPTITPRPVAISDALVDLVSAVAYEEPLLLVLDDMQWVDRASLALLLRMIRQVREEPVMVVLTFRSEELASREYDAISALVQEERASMNLLHTLSEEEVREMLTLDLDEPADRIEGLASRLHQVTRGHPLFLVELLRSLRDDGVLVTGPDGWRFRDLDPVALALPASVRLVIDKRLDQLSENARRLGSELATLPPSAGITRVRARLGLSDAAFTAALNELLDRAVVSWNPNGRLVFTHDQLREAMANGRRKTRNRAWVAAAAIALLAAVAGLAAMALKVGGRESRYGGGEIILQSGDSVAVMHPNGPPGDWSAKPFADDWPDRAATTRGKPQRLATGQVIWISSRSNPVQGPDGVILWAPHHRRDLEWPGDDRVGNLAPDGRHFLWATEHLDTPEYDLDLRVVDSLSGTSRVVAGPAPKASGLWSPDGRWIAVTLSLAQDSLLVITPSGGRLAGYSYFQVVLEDWCGPDLLMLVVRRAPTSDLTRILLDPFTGDERLLEAPATFGGKCSPDGTAYLARSLVEGGAVLAVTEIRGGRRFYLPDDTQWAEHVHWIPDHGTPVPEAVEADSEQITVPFGGTTSVGASVRYTDGTHHVEHLTWRSMDPAVASVRSDGTVAGNRQGATKVIAELAGWWADTVAVQVAKNDSAALVMADDFRSIDSLRWAPVGQPTVGLASVDHRQVLELLGDGRFVDGIVTREAKHLPGGLTVELQFLAPLTARELQDFRVWLGSATPPSDPSDGAWSSWHRGGQIQLLYPAYELDKWSPDLLRFYSSYQTEQVARIPDGVDPRHWTRLAIQVRADGLATVWLDGNRTASLQLPASFLEQPLRVGVFGRTHGTHSYVRDFAWWSEPRYR